MTQPVPDRLKSALKRTNRALNPRASFALEWEYRVAVAIPGPPVKIGCVAVDLETLGSMPAQISDMTLWPGPSGFVAMPQPGSIVRLTFRNGDPTKPMLTGLDPNSQPVLVMGFAPLIQLGDQLAVPLAKAVPLTTFYAALQTWTAAVAAALSSAGFPIVAAQAALVAAIATATSNAPTVKTLGS